MTFPSDYKPVFHFGPASADTIALALDVFARWSGNASCKDAASTVLESFTLAKPKPPETLTNAMIAKLWAAQRRTGGTAIQRRRRFARAVAQIAVEIAEAARQTEPQGEQEGTDVAG